MSVLAERPVYLLSFMVNISLAWMLHLDCMSSDMKDYKVYFMFIQFNSTLFKTRLKEKTIVRMLQVSATEKSTSIRAVGSLS